MPANHLIAGMARSYNINGVFQVEASPQCEF